jgi:two-component system, NarL family, nitrate/nitrite sensor histidine kinase NarX
MLQRWKTSFTNQSLPVMLGIGLLGTGMIVCIVNSWFLPLTVCIALAGWSISLWMYQRDRSKQVVIRQQINQTQLQLQKIEHERAEDMQRMEILLRLNHNLAQASSGALDERTVMENSLSALTDLVGALGCSFVPVDEWQQPLPPFTFGRLPEPVLRAWAMHLADGMLRTRCGTCRVLESTPGGCPLHPEQVGDTLTVQCLPLLRPGPMQPAAPAAESEYAPVLGVLHIYLPAGRHLDTHNHHLLDILLGEVAFAYESAHLRAQELSTLRQIQLLHSPENDLNVSLGSLLEGLKQALEVSYIVVQLRPAHDERLSNLSVSTGSLADPQALIDSVFDQVLRGQSAGSEPEQLPAWLALPITLPEGPVLGMLLAASDQPYEFHLRRQTILQTVAAQAALLVENERLVRSMEYKAVIQERTRLAREIHDGLAQTLAYLKLQAGQMQSYLAQGDLGRLSQVLKDNYQALAEAYLDTRQAIDNLRITPQDGFSAWLERILDEFAASTQIGTEIMIEPAAAVRAETIPLEIQAQLIRIVQESLSNVRKHARARQVTAALRQWHNDLVIEVRDDGLGFEAGDIPEISRHGLRGMRERAEMIGADFQVISQEHRGTTVRLVLPFILEEKPS